MSHLVWSTSFKRSYRKQVKQHPYERLKIIAVMKQLQNDPYSPTLKTHKLRGVLEGTWACSVDYDLRIVFQFVNHPQTGEEEILLVDIGTHEEVY